MSSKKGTGAFLYEVPSIWILASTTRPLGYQAQVQHFMNAAT